MKGMLTTRVIAWTTTVTALVCLAAGFGLKGYWAILLLFLVLPILWFVRRKISPRLVVSALFFIYVIAAATGLLIGLVPVLMVVGLASALAGWESAQFLLNFQDGSMEVIDRRLERLHTRDLAIALGSGLLLSILGLAIHFHLPFGVTAALALVVMYGMYRAYASLSRIS